MKKQSFSQRVKEHLKDQPIKKKCCRRAFEDGCNIYSGADDPATLVRNGAAGLVCAECQSKFLAGLFVVSGNVSDPQKSYHLEFSFAGKTEADAVAEVLNSAGFEPGRSIRKGRFLLYFKNSTSIEDILGYIGASAGAFDLMNAKIVREMRETTNRQVNCDSANIAKTLGAAEKHIKIIQELQDHGSIGHMSADLRETAEIRLEYPDASISELGQRFTKPISKSGVKHRLDKIVEFYEKEKKKWNIEQGEE